MTCPSPMHLFLAAEKRSGEPLAHAKECEACQRALAGMRRLDEALLRVRDPAPPADFLAGVMRRVDSSVEAAARSSRQLFFGLAASLAVLGTLSAFLGHERVLYSAVQVVQAICGLVTAALALQRTLPPSLGAPVFTVQALALLGFTLLMRQFLLMTPSKS